MNDNYIPVACSFYDQLELFAMRRTAVNIHYTSENQNHEVEGIIKDVYCAEDRVEYLKMDNDLIIRLDTITKLNDETPTGYC